MSEWPIEIKKFEYQPIPSSWLRHPSALAPETNEQLVFAVSAAKYGKSLRVRYLHPFTNDVIRAITGARKHKGGLVPAELKTKSGWPAAMPADVRPVGVARQPEIRHFDELWKQRISSGLETETPA